MVNVVYEAFHDIIGPKITKNKLKLIYSRKKQQPEVESLSPKLIHRRRSEDPTGTSDGG